MPGKIVKILVTTGDAVKAGDPVVTLEAMKMENELCAPVGGTVKAIPIQIGDSVEGGQLLVSIG
jgi:biotin carboxyl carrier protein